MKIKNSFFENGISELKKLGEMDLPIQTSVMIAKGFKELDVVIKSYQETKQKLLDKYGTISEDKQKYTFEDENLVAFQKEFEELLNVENEVKFDKVTLPKDMKLSANFLMALENFIAIEE
ncbi:hypothetical protein D4R86_00440 [bacterium]|nr:MAG: hypothetical protein D4R86_00440 [bacterium]